MRPQAFEIGGATVDVASLDDLARVAEKHGRLIHWVAKEGAYDFFVPTGETLYAFRLTVSEAPAPPVEDNAPTSMQTEKPVSADDLQETPG